MSPTVINQAVTARQFTQHLGKFSPCANAAERVMQKDDSTTISERIVPELAYADIGTTNFNNTIYALQTKSPASSWHCLATNTSCAHSQCIRPKSKA